MRFNQRRRRVWFRFLFLRFFLRRPPIICVVAMFSTFLREAAGLGAAGLGAAGAGAGAAGAGAAGAGAAGLKLLGPIPISTRVKYINIL